MVLPRSLRRKRAKEPGTWNGGDSVTGCNPETALNSIDESAPRYQYMTMYA